MSDKQPLTAITPEHFRKVFGDSESFTDAYIFSKRKQLCSFYGFATTLAEIGNKDSFRTALTLGYNAEFKTN